MSGLEQVAAAAGVMTNPRENRWKPHTAAGPLHRHVDGGIDVGLRGTLEDWDRSADLSSIDVPTLVIGATHDTMDPAHMRWMADQLPRGTYVHCPEGSHLAQYDDPDHYFRGLIDYLTALA